MSTISSGTTLTTALVQTGDTTGDLVIKTGGSNTTAMTISGTDQSVVLAGSLTANTNASTITTGTVPTARLASGTANSSTYLRGDQTWAAIASSQWVTSGSNISYTTGNVGIGNSSPTTKLTIASASYQDHLLIDRTGVGSMQITASNPRGLAITDGTNAFLQIVQSNGSVGIGTSSPISDAKLTISAPLEPILFFQRSDAGNNDAAIQVTSGGAFSFKNGADSSTAAGLTEQLRIDGSGNLLFNSGYGSVATAYGCRAWVNFNGTGTVAIRASGNVSSISDNGTGDYTINFTTAMPNTNYSIAAWARHNDDTGGRSVCSGRNSGTKTTSAVAVLTGYSGQAGTQDSPEVGVAIFR
jgi:hypothetical protein